MTRVRRWLAPWAMAVCAALASVPAQAQDTSPENCVHVYSAAARLQSFLMGAAAEGEAAPSLGGLTDNWLPTHEWDTRRRAVAEKGAPIGIGLTPQGQKRGDELYLESASTGLYSMLEPDKVFAGQRQLFAEIRACDLAHGFDPPLGVPPSHEVVIDLLERQEAVRSEQFLARLDALSNLTDLQCAARFYLTGSLMANDPAFQQAASRKMQVAGSRASAAMPDVTPDRLRELIQREIQERGSEVTSPEDVDPLLEEVNACERKYEMPLTTKNAG